MSDAAITLRASEDRITCVAAQCGWASAANFYVALDRAVGHTPTEITALTEIQFAEILEQSLQTNLATLVRPRHEYEARST